MRGLTSVARVLLVVGAVFLGILGLGLFSTGVYAMQGIVFGVLGIVALVMGLALKAPGEGEKVVEIHHYHDSFDGRAATPKPKPVKSADEIERGIDWSKF